MVPPFWALGLSGIGYSFEDTEADDGGEETAVEGLDAVETAGAEAEGAVMVAAGLVEPEPQPTSISDRSKIPARKHKMVFFIDFSPWLILLLSI
jgi:hypothetical protein